MGELDVHRPPDGWPHRALHLVRPRLYLPTAIALVLVLTLAGYGWSTLAAAGPGPAIRTGDLRYAGPTVLGAVALIMLAERCWPAGPRPAAGSRPLAARGARTDLLYLGAYALVVLPIVTLLGAGSATLLERHAPWLMLPPITAVPHWAFLVLGLLAIDATDWLVHLLNHDAEPLWRLHAVHHSQEEVSVLTTFRAHPLVHLSFTLTAIPGFVLAANGATPATMLSAYAVLGALPHANLRWSYGPLGRVLISPAYHRIHHRATGRLDVNLGVVFPFWDQLSRRAIFPTRGAPPARTGLAGRPVPVEQAPHRPSLGRVVVAQWIEPFRPPVRAQVGELATGARVASGGG